MAKVFISYSRVDIDSANGLYLKLKGEKSVVPWFDKKSLLPGMKWQPAIRKQIRESDFFLALISSRSTSKRGYVQSELKMAMEVLKEFPDDQIFLIPVRLDDCEMPTEDLREINYVDLFTGWDDGVEEILSVIRSKTTIPSTLPGKTIPSASRDNTGWYEYQYRVGIVDLDIGLTNLVNIAQHLNSIQKYFHFTCPILPKLTNCIKSYDGSKNLDVHLIPSTFYAEHPYLGVDLVACLSRYPLAFRDEGFTQYNYFSGPGEKDRRFLFISTYELYQYTKQASCTFERGIIYILISQLVAYFTDLDYHSETRGCVMDFCENRDDLVKGLKQLKFCRQCERRIEDPALKTALYALLADESKFCQASV